MERRDNTVVTWTNRIQQMARPPKSTDAAPTVQESNRPRNTKKKPKRKRIYRVFFLFCLHLLFGDRWRPGKRSWWRHPFRAKENVDWPTRRSHDVIFSEPRKMLIGNREEPWRHFFVAKANVDWPSRRSHDVIFSEPRKMLIGRREEAVTSLTFNEQLIPHPPTNREGIKWNKKISPPIRNGVATEMFRDLIAVTVEGEKIVNRHTGAFHTFFLPTY